MTKQKKQILITLDRVEIILNEASRLICIQLDDYEKEYGKTMKLNPLEFIILHIMADLGPMIQTNKDFPHRN